LKPGLTPSPLSLEFCGFDITGDTRDTEDTGYDLGRTILFLWTIAGLITGGTFAGIPGFADLVITTAGSDGFVMSTATSESGDDIITGRVLGSGRTSVSRETGYGDTPSSRLSAQSDGTLILY
jgi:hypothetical protein